MAKVKSVRGQEIDMSRLYSDNQEAIAVTGGGIKKNARGDVLGDGNIVIRTAQEIDSETAEQLEQQNISLASGEFFNQKLGSADDFLNKDGPAPKRPVKEEPVVTKPSTTEDRPTTNPVDPVSPVKGDDGIDKDGPVQNDPQEPDKVETTSSTTKPTKRRSTRKKTTENI